MIGASIGLRDKWLGRLLAALLSGVDLGVEKDEAQCSLSLVIRTSDGIIAALNISLVLV